MIVPHPPTPPFWPLVNHGREVRKSVTFITSPVFAGQHLLCISLLNTVLLMAYHKIFPFPHNHIIRVWHDRHARDQITLYTDACIWSYVARTRARARMLCLYLRVILKNIKWSEFSSFHVAPLFIRTWTFPFFYVGVNFNLIVVLPTKRIPKKYSRVIEYVLLCLYFVFQWFVKLIVALVTQYIFVDLFCICTAINFL